MKGTAGEERTTHWMNGGVTEEIEEVTEETNMEGMKETTKEEASVTTRAANGIGTTERKPKKTLKCESMKETTVTTKVPNTANEMKEKGAENDTSHAIMTHRTATTVKVEMTDGTSKREAKTRQMIAENRVELVREEKKL